MRVNKFVSRPCSEHSFYADNQPIAAGNDRSLLLT